MSVRACPCLGKVPGAEGQAFRSEWLPDPSPDQTAFQDAFRFRLVRIAHREKRFVLKLPEK